VLSRRLFPTWQEIYAGPLYFIGGHACWFRRQNPHDQRSWFSGFLYHAIHGKYPFKPLERSLVLIYSVYPVITMWFPRQLLCHPSPTRFMVGRRRLPFLEIPNHRQAVRLVGCHYLLLAG
jgi:hypothetical protein